MKYSYYYPNGTPFTKLNLNNVGAIEYLLYGINTDGFDPAIDMIQVKIPGQSPSACTLSNLLRHKEYGEFHTDVSNDMNELISKVELGDFLKPSRAISELHLAADQVKEHSSGLAHILFIHGLNRIKEGFSKVTVDLVNHVLVVNTDNDGYDPVHEYVCHVVSVYNAGLFDGDAISIDPFTDRLCVWIKTHLEAHGINTIPLV